ncbi:Phospholipase C [Ceratobasidium sp. 392]|nr:Phospholipase C [Ceratobasidium sp. 392]
MLSWDRMCRALAEETVRGEKFLLNKVLMGIPLEELGFSITHETHIFDNQNNAAKGYSMFTDRKNEFHRLRFSLVSAILKRPELAAKLFWGMYEEDGKKKIAYNDGGVRDWLDKVSEMTGRLLFLMHSLGGQPGRGTEVVILKLYNTKLRLRNLFCLGPGKIVYILFYNKSTGNTGVDRVVAHAVPWRIGRMLLILQSLACPFASVLIGDLYGTGGSSITERLLCVTNIRLTLTKSWSSSTWSIPLPNGLSTNNPRPLLPTMLYGTTACSIIPPSHPSTGHPPQGGVEVDICDGDTEPVITQGQTLTGSVPLRHVAQAKHAFLATDASCCNFLEAFGDALVTASIEGSVWTGPSDVEVLEALPSPEQLKGRMLVKLKNALLSEVEVEVDHEDERSKETGTSDTGSVKVFDAKLSQGMLIAKPMRRSFRGAKRPDMSELYPSTVPSPSPYNLDPMSAALGPAAAATPSPSLPIPRSQPTSPPRKKQRAYSNISEHHEKPKPKMSCSLARRSLCGLNKKERYGAEQMFSLSKKTANKVTKENAMGLVKHCWTNFVRLYPNGTRAASTNYDPTRYWAAGRYMGGPNTPPGLSRARRSTIEALVVT